MSLHLLVRTRLTSRGTPFTCVPTGLLYFQKRKVGLCVHVNKSLHVIHHPQQPWGDAVGIAQLVCEVEQNQRDRVGLIGSENKLLVSPLLLFLTVDLQNLEGFDWGEWTAWSKPKQWFVNMVKSSDLWLYVLDTWVKKWALLSTDHHLIGLDQMEGWGVVVLRPLRKWKLGVGCVQPWFLPYSDWK